jgi:hypothetical protein
MSRKLSSANSASEPSVAGVIIGGSNARLLSDAFNDLGKEVITLATGGWCVSKENVDGLLPKLRELLDGLDPSVPVIIWCLDNSAFKALNQNGDLTSVTRLPTDKKFHVIGDLTVTPFCLLSNIMKEMDRIVLACGQRRVYILEVVPRFFLKPCCGDPTHCGRCRETVPARPVGSQQQDGGPPLLRHITVCLNRRHSVRDHQLLHG